MNNRFLRLLLLSIMIFACQNSYSKELTLGFDGLADLGTNVDAFGITFTGATVLACGGSLNCVPFPPYSGRNVIYDQPGYSGVITAVFNEAETGPVTKVSARITGNRSITMTAYDKDGNVVGVEETGGANYVGSDSGIAPNKLLTIDATGTSNSIVKVTMHDGGNTFTVDDFTFESNPKVVILDPGHGKLKGSDGLFHYQRPATANHFLHEDDLTLAMSNAALGYLKQKKYTAYATRTGSDALYKRVCGEDKTPKYSICNADLVLRNKFTHKYETSGNDVIFVSIHTNGGTLNRALHGRTQTFYCKDSSLVLAQELYDQVTSVFPINAHLLSPVMQDCELGVLKGPQKSSSLASLIEVLYHSDSEDEDLLANAANLTSAGQAIAKAAINVMQKDAGK